MAISRMRSKNTQYCSCYRNNLDYLIVAHIAVRQISRFTEYVSSSIKNQLKAPSNRRNFAIYKEIAVKESNADVRFFFTGTA